MPRGNNSRSINRHNNNALVVLTADRFLSKDYARDVKLVHSMNGILAERLGNRGDLAQALQDVDDGSFLEDQKSRIISLAEENAKQMEYIKTFSNALNQIRVETENDNDIENDGSCKRDYSQLLQQHMEVYSQRNDNNKYEEMIRQVRIKLGVEIENENIDDDLEVMHKSTSANEVLAMKCPVTGTFFEDPVRNVHCGHTYSRAGLTQLRRLRKNNCPVAGCPNNRLDEVEDDVEMMLKVQHYKKKTERMKAKQEELNEDENEYKYEENNGNGLTVIN